MSVAGHWRSNAQADPKANGAGACLPQVRCPMLEPYSAKVARTVLTGAGWREPLPLPDRNRQRFPPLPVPDRASAHRTSAHSAKSWSNSLWVAWEVELATAGASAGGLLATSAGRSVWALASLSDCI